MALSQQRAATLVVTKDSDDPPTYEVIPYSTGRWRQRNLLAPLAISFATWLVVRLKWGRILS